MFIIIAYDIPEDKTRAKVYKALMGFGTPVQKSVFEAIVTPGQLIRMKSEVMQLIDPAVDQVRYYYQGEECRLRNRQVGLARTASDPVAVIT